MPNTTSDLANFVATAPLADTHEHLASEEQYLDEPADILVEVFDGGYIAADLRVAGATQAAIDRLLDPHDRDIPARFAGIVDAWEACQWTDFGRAIRIIARAFFDIEHMTLDALLDAQTRLKPHAPGERHRLLTAANIDHVQIDNVSPLCVLDPDNPAFFLQDINWLKPASADLDLPWLTTHTGVTIKNANSLHDALEALFHANAPNAIAVKSQHAYVRTLRWQPHTSSEIDPLIQRLLAGQVLAAPDALAVGDWALAIAVEAARTHDLPVKLHTGYMAGYGGMPLEWVHPENLCPLLKHYPDVRFVLMHTGYPFGGEIIALAKHYPNVFVDLCWAWALDSFSTVDFVRRYLHAAPINKLFAHGGDTQRPRASVAYSRQARHGLTHALEAEIAGGDLTEPEAVTIAARVMRENQYNCFNIPARQAAFNERAAQASAQARNPTE